MKHRHCERSEAIQYDGLNYLGVLSFAMTVVLGLAATGKKPGKANTSKIRE